MQRRTALCGIVTMLWMAGSGDPRRSAAGALTHTVAIDGVTFTPTLLTVTVGDTVVWVNKDPFPHTVTSPAGAFDSRSIAPGQSWHYTPTKAGVFPYFCTLHPTMHATLTVE
jgi:plastocyanin